MTTPDVPAGSPCWIDLMTSDPTRSRAFYGELFGWAAGDSSPEFGGYFMFTRDGMPVAGAMPTPPGPDPSDQWGIYLAVDDVRKTVEAAHAHGARVGAEPMEVADLGTSAVIYDPGGARIGLWQANTFGGFGSGMGDGAASWFELSTRDYDAVVAFYREVIGWDTHVVSDTPEFRYTTLGRDDQGRAGVMDATGLLPDGAPGQWSVYFAVDDTDAALARVADLGGALVRPAEDTPYGRLASVSDPGGVQFKLMAPNQAMPARAPSS